MVDSRFFRVLRIGPNACASLTTQPSFTNSSSKKYITIDNAWFFSSAKRAHYYLIFVHLPCEKENLLCLHDSMFPRLDLFLNYFYLIQYNVKCYKKSDDASLFKPGGLSSQETLHHFSFILWGQLTILLALFTRN